MKTKVYLYENWSDIGFGYKWCWVWKEHGVWFAEAC